MKYEDSIYPNDWLRIAEKDWGRVEFLLEVHDHEAAGFYLQQSVEKFLKAFLLSKGWELDRIHDLEALLQDATVYDPSLEKFRTLCQKITGFYFIERYPLIVESGLAEEDVSEAAQQVTALVEKIKTALHANGVK
ncbi:MAG: HEPN domain-containing protein [candidate division KSB1 bacterium]